MHALYKDVSPEATYGFTVYASTYMYAVTGLGSIVVSVCVY